MVEGAAGNGSALRAEKVIIEARGPATSESPPAKAPANPGAKAAEVDQAQPPAEATSTAKLGEAAMTEEQKAAAVEAALEGVEEAGKETEKLAAEAVKEEVRQATVLLKETKVDVRVVLKLLSGGETTIGALEGQMGAEIDIVDRKKITPAEKQKLIDGIQKKYKKLSEYAANREESTRSQIEKLKKSTSPEDQALVLDIEIARAQVDLQSYKQTIDSLQATLHGGLNPRTGDPLTPAERTKYQIKIDALATERKQLEAKIGDENEKGGLKEKRKGIKNNEGQEIPNIIEKMAIVLTSGTVEAIAKAKENPVGHIEGIMAEALTDEAAMNQLVANLEGSKLIKGDKDKAEFMKFMKLGLTTEEKIEMIKKEGGNTLISLVGVMGLLGYVAWKKTLEGGGQPMMS